MAIDTTRYDVAAHEEARAEALRDTDSFSEWLQQCCMYRKPSEFQPLQRDKTAIDFLGFAANDLVSLLMDQGQPAQITRAVRDVLADRYCATENVAKWIAHRAAEIAVEMAYDAREAA